MLAWKVPYFAQMKIVHNTDLIQMDFRTEKNKIESTPILKLAMVKGAVPGKAGKAAALPRFWKIEGDGAPPL